MDTFTLPLLQNDKQQVTYNPTIYIHPFVVVAAYIIMVGLNIFSNVYYNRKATTGYGYTWLQPDGTTFSVWGFIYFLQALFIISQVWLPHIRNDERVILARPAYVLQCILNGAWLISNAEANLDGLSSYWLAVAILVANVLFLFFGVYWYVAQDANPYKFEVETEAPKRFFVWRSKRQAQWRWLVWYPISANLAWIFVASILNAASTVIDIVYLNTQETAVGGADFAIGVALFAALLAIHNCLTRQDLGYAIVTIWALWGVYRNQTNPNSGFPHQQNKTLSNAALLAIGLVSAAILIGWGLEYFGAIPTKRVAINVESKSSPKEKNGSESAGSSSQAGKDELGVNAA